MKLLINCMGLHRKQETHPEREVANGGVASLNGRIDDLYAVDSTIASLIDRLSSVI